jgi:hypothetical protein
MMKYLKLLCRKGRNLVLALAGWLAVHGTAAAQVAQQGQKKQEAEGGSYVLAYGLVILGIALGLLVVCRSSRRRDRAKPEQYEESKVM